LSEQLARMDSRLERVERDVAELKTDVAALKTDVAELRVHVGVLHEEVLDRLEATRVTIPWELLATKQELPDDREATDRRLRPLEAVVKIHSAEIAALQRQRGKR
jgi:phage shock protein A